MGSDAVARLYEASPDGLLQPLYIIKRMLPELVCPGVAKQCVFPPGIVKYGRGNFFSVRAIGNNGPYRIGAIINPDHIRFLFHTAVRVKEGLLIVKVKINFQMIILDAELNSGTN
jgi:hypothetical protein